MLVVILIVVYRYVFVGLGYESAQDMLVLSVAIEWRRMDEVCIFDSMQATYTSKQLNNLQIDTEQIHPSITDVHSFAHHHHHYHFLYSQIGSMTLALHLICQATLLVPFYSLLLHLYHHHLLYWPIYVPIIFVQLLPPLLCQAVLILILIKDTRSFFLLKGSHAATRVFSLPHKENVSWTSDTYTAGIQALHNLIATVK